MQHKITLLLLLSLFLFPACTASPSATPCTGINCESPTFTETLRIYQTDTQTPTATPPLIKSPTPTLTATVTPTPITYIVKTSDDMYGIAFSFGISPQALMTANPSVNPRMMSVGEVLVIPITPGAPKTTATSKPSGSTPTAISVSTHVPDCYLDTDGELWCFLLVTNNQSTNLESITGVIHLFIQGQNKSIDQDVTTLLDILPAGQSAPLVAYFSGVNSSTFSATGEITFSSTQPNPDTSYLSVAIGDQQVNIAADGKSATVSGALSLKSENSTASQVDIALTAYASNGAVVGVRKWESTDKLASGGSLNFDVPVYSLGPGIDHVTILAEARP